MPDSPDILTAAQALICRIDDVPARIDWPELAALRLAVEAARSSHVYVSTACQHAKHERCRQRCKFCAVDCGCPCHVELFPITGDAAKAAGDDAARLNAMIVNQWTVSGSPAPQLTKEFICGQPFQKWPDCIRGEGSTWREAIDAAMAAEGQGEGK